MKRPAPYKVRLFYSYSHKDQESQQRMERTLRLLQSQDGILDSWSDQQILPGQRISRKIRERMDQTHIFAFLLSPDFVASDPCLEEWKYARELADRKPGVALVPVILRTCAWRDVPGMSDFKALPVDARPIAIASDVDTSWNEVYDGLKTVIRQVRSTFAVRASFRDRLLKTEFVSQEHISLPDIFVFPNLVAHQPTDDDEARELRLSAAEELLNRPRTIIRGDQLSGKTTLLNHLFLELSATSAPVLYVDLAKTNRPPSPEVFRDAYRHQYHGDYELWQDGGPTTVLLDNLGPEPRTLAHLLLAAETFDTVVVTVSTQTFYAYYHDEPQLAHFRTAELSPLTHNQQETLIRRRLAITEGGSTSFSDGHVDQVENRVNAIILNNRILPRYPFYVLSILQTYEAFVPGDVTISSYGHCYFVLIVSYLRKAGVSARDDAIEACLNFAEHFAFELFSADSVEVGLPDEAFRRFVTSYRDRFLFGDSLLSRLTKGHYALIRDGRFRNEYMYYFFLGRHIAKNADTHHRLIDRLVDGSYRTANFLTLMFTIHHTTDDQILDEILLRTMCALDDIEPASLDEDESRLFEDVVHRIPARVLSNNSIESERRRQRRIRDREEELDAVDPSPEGDDVAVEVFNDIYRIMKNSDVLGQILKNKHGSLTKEKITEVIETVADGGLRIVKIPLGRQDEMNELAVFVHKSHPEFSIERIRQAVLRLAFVWTMVHVERIVRVLNGPEIRELVEDVVETRDSPAYDLVGYFLRLDSAGAVGEQEVRSLRRLWKRRSYSFFRKVLSLRTQFYLNTHRVAAPVEQAICASLGIKYRARLKGRQ